MQYTKDDHRTDADRGATIGFVVANDSFMSGWGLAPGRSLFAVPFRTWDQAKIVEDNMHNRSEMKYVRVVGHDWRPHLKNGDHLSIRSMDDSGRFYQEGGF